MSMRPAAQLLLAEAVAIEPILQNAADQDFDLPTVCDGWSVRDVMAHCAAALTRTATDNRHAFTPEDNQRDVDERRSYGPGRVLAELLEGYELAAHAIDAAAGELDGVGLGEWMHGGDIRDALGLPGAYTSEGIELALPLLIERSQQLGGAAVLVRLPDVELQFGVGDPTGTLTTDVETFVRICGGRRPDSSRYELSADLSVADMTIFT